MKMRFLFALAAAILAAALLRVEGAFAPSFEIDEVNGTLNAALSLPTVSGSEDAWIIDLGNPIFNFNFTSVALGEPGNDSLKNEIVVLSPTELSWTSDIPKTLQDGSLPTTLTLADGIIDNGLGVTRPLVLKDLGDAPRGTVPETGATATLLVVAGCGLFGLSRLRRSISSP
jgi:hypothetical protein